MHHHVFAHHEGGGKIDSASLNLRATFRKSAKPKLKDSMQRRLDEVVVLEITQDGYVNICQSVMFLLLKLIFSV
jgi:hypothetical protein